MSRRRRLIASWLLVGSVAALMVVAGIWKTESLGTASAAAQNPPEPMESVTAAVAQSREHRPVTTAIGTVVALRSITLRNELPGTVRAVHLTPGRIVEAGTLLVALDVSVERAELRAQEAQAALARATLERVERMSARGAASEMELDAARAERDVALAQVARTRAIIARKTIRAPFRARLGISDVHAGQYLNEGTVLTTLQGVDDGAYVDFAVAQHVAAGLRDGASVSILAADGSTPVAGSIVAIDARIDPETRNATVRARVMGVAGAPAPGASVRVEVPVGPARAAVAVPVSALRKGPEGEHVFVLEPEDDGKLRAHLRRVRAGEVVGEDVLIEEGLAAGERVAASGAFKLRESVLVAVANAPATRLAGG